MPMLPKTFNCPNCGAPLPIKHRFVKMATCDFCAQVSLIRDTGLDPTGRTAKLAELPSPLFVDATGSLAGRRFRVMGRLRYQYPTGQWDEWFVVFDDDQPGWLIEDEGEFKLMRKGPLSGTVPPYEAVDVGYEYLIGGRKVYIVEKDQGVIAGGEGQVVFPLLPGEPVNYVDGLSGSDQIGLEYVDETIELSIGRAIERRDLVIDDDA